MEASDWMSGIVSRHVTVTALKLLNRRGRHFTFMGETVDTFTLCIMKKVDSILFLLTDVEYNRASEICQHLMPAPNTLMYISRLGEEKAKHGFFVVATSMGW